jgi:chromosome segregation ATPase
MSDLEVRVSLLEEKQETLKEDITDLKEGVKRLSESLVQLHARLDVREERMATMANELNKLNLKIDQVQTEIGRKFESLESKFPGWKTYVALGVLAASGLGAAEILKLLAGL